MFSFVAGTMETKAREALIYSVLSFPHPITLFECKLRREPSYIKALVPRFCGEDE